MTLVDTLPGKPLTIKIEKGKVKTNGASVLITDIRTNNGVIRYIDRVLFHK